MKRLALTITLALICVILACPVWAITPAQILARIKAAEAPLKDVKAEMAITSANKGNISDMGAGYADIVGLEKGIISYKKPDKFRMDGYARGIKASLVQNGYRKLVLAAMIRQTEDVKDKPGKRFNSLDIGFLSSRLWLENTVTIVGSAKGSTVELRLVPKSTEKDKRHDNIWIDVATLKLLKREKYRGSGEMRIRYVYTDFEMLAGKLPIATTSTMYNPSGEKMGTVTYKNVKANVGLADSLFSMTQR